MNDIAPTPSAEKRRSPHLWFALALLMIPLNVVVFQAVITAPGISLSLVTAWILVLVFSLIQIVFAVLAFTALLRKRDGSRGWRIAGLLGSVALALVGVAEGLLGSAIVLLSGAAWGRPLRIRGRLLHPELKHGADWSRGGFPSVDGLDPDTRRALEALWLHDAQKEHASVPAFARITWLLCAAGAPPRLIEGSQRAGLQESDHACRCFALAAAYGGRSHSVETMPELLLGGLDLEGSVLTVLARESVTDGCLLEDFNADVACACAEVCREPVTRDVLSRIAEEERSHAAFSWDVLEWALQRGGAPVANAVAEALDRLAKIPRPTSTSRVTQPLVARADAVLLRAHGRITDSEWESLWPVRVNATVVRTRQLLGFDRPTELDSQHNSKPLHSSA
jgi:hypothetical protein